MTLIRTRSADETGGVVASPHVRGATSQFLREPIIHFFLFSAMFLGIYQWLAVDSEQAPDTIVVTAERMTQLGLMFEKARQRLPTEAEMKELIDDFVREEIYYREAIKLGLDTDDTVIRRRLRQKMEFLGNVAADMLQPGESELQEFFVANQQKFAEEPRFALEHIYLNPARRGEQLDADAAAVLSQLSAFLSTDQSSLGDPTTLPAQLPETGRSGLESIFGKAFVADIEKLEPGRWSGPVKSDYGVHIVRLNRIVASRIPNFETVREAVKNEWSYHRRDELEKLRFDEYLKHYDVQIRSGQPTAEP